MYLDAEALTALVAFRRALHAEPELSGEEEGTAWAVAEFLTPTQPDQVIAELGGHGVAFVYEGREAGPTVMFRAELDALPIAERSTASHRSRRAGRAHLCGHDGHMASLAALGLGFAAQRPRRGRAVLLFQPAEETGAGAERVLDDPKFEALAPDFVFAWHNMPGLPFGRAALKAGPIACASRGLRARLAGWTSHASTPELGRSPMRALAALMPELTALGRGGALDDGYSLVTVTHAELGERAFGVAPGEAELWATLRTLTDATMASLVTAAEARVGARASAEGLTVDLGYEDVFAHCENAPEAVAPLADALRGEGVSFGPEGQPMRASEDFGRFRARAPTAMMFLGAGEGHPGLHNPDYDFPDPLLPIAAGVLHGRRPRPVGLIAGVSAAFNTPLAGGPLQDRRACLRL